MAKRAGTWREFWDNLATSRDLIAATDRPTVPPETYQLYGVEILRKLALNSDDVLLDVGCGTGLIDAQVAPHVRDVFAIDFSYMMTHKTKATTLALGNVHTINCDSTSLPFKDKVFPKVVMYAVAQYLSRRQIEQVIEEMQRVTQPGGKIMLGEIPRARDASFLNRVRDVWKHQGLGGVIRKVHDLTLELALRVTGCFTQKFVRPKGPPIILHAESDLLDMVHRCGMRGQVLDQDERLPWFHQTFDLLIEVPVD
jgi:ubiquinone/menaquinone biosynthesis C-methylase UbiE